MVACIDQIRVDGWVKAVESGYMSIQTHCLCGCLISLGRPSSLLRLRDVVQPFGDGQDDSQ